MGNYSGRSAKYVFQAPNDVSVDTAGRVIEVFLFCVIADTFYIQLPTYGGIRSQLLYPDLLALGP